MKGLTKIALALAGTAAGGVGVHEHLKWARKRKREVKNEKAVKEYVKKATGSGHEKTEHYRRVLKTFGGPTSPSAAKYQATTAGTLIRVTQMREKAAKRDRQKQTAKNVAHAIRNPRDAYAAAKKAAETKRQKRGQQ